LLVHSFTSVHVIPLPWYPGLHAHEKLPGVLVHSAFAPQFAAPVVHSFTSVQSVPVPVYPALHAQVNEPSRFVQVAFGSHGLFVHSFTSVHVIPSPA
jgi:hypothetical protein